MRTVCIQNMSEFEDCCAEIKAFINKVQPDYASHVVDALIEWFNSFTTDEHASFASRRGLNFLGRTSRLESLFFLLVYDDAEQLAAFAPLFRFRVSSTDPVHSCEMLAFCPDSTVFFYHDIRIRQGSEAAAIQNIFEFFRQYNRSSAYIVLFNHIPSDSCNFPLLVQGSIELSRYGFHAGVSPVFWRGGIYPWNAEKLSMILESALNDDSYSDLTRTQISRVLDALGGSHKTMLAFKNNHGPLKAILYGIFSENRPSEPLCELYNAIEPVFQSCPVKYPYLALPASPEEFASALSSSKRYYYQRYRTRFFSGNGRFEKLHGGSVTDQDIHDFIELHRERWGRSSNILNGLTAEFVFTFLKKMAVNGLLTLFFAVYEAERIACICCIDFNRRREFFSSGRSLRNEKLRAGKLLLHETILDAIQEGYALFDFAYGDEAYKADFNWSYRINNVVALFHNLHPKQFPNLFPLYEEVML